MSKQFSPFTIRLLSRIMLASFFLFSLAVALLLLPVVLFLVCFLGCALLAIFLLRKFLPKKKPVSDEYDIEVYPITDDELEDSLDGLQKNSRGKRIERH